MIGSYVEKEFIKWCEEFGFQSEKIGRIFIDEHSRYLIEYYPNIERFITGLYKQLRKEHPNISFSLKGRFKSKRSFLIKSFCKLAENITQLFDPASQYRESDFEKFFSFLIAEYNSNDMVEMTDTQRKMYEAYIKIEEFLMGKQGAVNSEGKTKSQSTTTENLNYILSLLPPEAQNKLIRRLGRTEDTFAYKIVVHGIEYQIDNFSIDANGNLFALDSENKKIPILKSISINPEVDIHKDVKTGFEFIILPDGKRVPINELNLLYDKSITAENRNLANAKRDSNGNITVLGDAIVQSDGTDLDISSDLSWHYDLKTNSLCLHIGQKTINLSELKNLKIKKYDEDSVIKATYALDSSAITYHNEHDFMHIPYRRKDYIKSPKITGYKSIHNSYISKNKIALEGQLKSLLMERRAKNETYDTGHDKYKLRKKVIKEQNPFVARISAQDPYATDSSTEAIIHLLSEHSDLKLEDILGNYMMVTSGADGTVLIYKPDIDFVFNHFFKYTRKDENGDLILNGINYRDYEHYLASLTTRDFGSSFVDETMSNYRLDVEPVINSSSGISLDD